MEIREPSWSNMTSQCQVRVWPPLVSVTDYPRLGTNTENKLTTGPARSTNKDLAYVATGKIRDAD